MRVSGVAVTLVNVRAWTGEAWVNFPLTLGGVPVNLRGFGAEEWQDLLVDAHGHLAVNIGLPDAFYTKQVDITDAGEMIVDVHGGRKSLCIRNIGDNDVELGGDGVPWGEGFRLKPGDALSEIRTVDAIYGICDTYLTSRVCVWYEA